MMKSIALSTLLFSVWASPAGAISGDSRFLQGDSNCTEIIDILCDTDGKYPTGLLCDAIEIAKIEDALGNDTWTIFAPTDDAWASMPPEVMNALFGDTVVGDTTVLSDLLAFHSVQGVALESTDLLCDGETLMSNDEFSVTICEEDRVYQVGMGNSVAVYPEIAVTDIEACNGVVHLVSEMMLWENLALTQPPTDGPSMEPSLLPSDGPSMEPSQLPSDGPSMEPSQLPSDGPSMEPSLLPSDGPSMEPSLLPSVGPSMEPSLLPSDGPSMEPSLLPSDGPSMEPSLLPSVGQSMEPSLLPSVGPSMEPSLLPSDGPSMEPSLLSSDGPSMATSQDPTAAPTASPLEELSAPPTGSIPASPVEPTKAPTKEVCSITEIVCGNPDLNYFCASLTATGIADKFDDYSGHYTVFAPSDSAFEHLGDAAIDYLMQPDNVDLLSKIFAFHTVEDQTIYSHDLTCQETIKMANGKDSRSVCRKQKLYQKGKGNSAEYRPEVVEVDIETCNGVIHVVNQVMLFDYPEELGIPLGAVISPTLPPSVAPTVSKARNPVSCKTIDRLVCENPDFSILCDNLDRTELSNALTTGTWTLFAPNNEAFLKLPPNYVNTLKIDGDVLTELLLFHTVAEQALYKDDLPCIAGQNLIKMANGKDSRTLCEDIRPGVPVPKYQKGKYNQRGETAPEFVTFDMKACNGVVHELDTVLLFKQIEE